MKTRTIGIIMNGVTGRMGANQHLVRSMLAIRSQGGVPLGPDEAILPEPILVGRNAAKLAALARQHGVERFTTDLDCRPGRFPLRGLLRRPGHQPAGAQRARRPLPPASTSTPKSRWPPRTAEALALYRQAVAAGVKHGVVQDKLWLPGLLKLKSLVGRRLLRPHPLRSRRVRLLGLRRLPISPASGQAGTTAARTGGGIIIDMFCHWRYVIDNLFGPDPFAGGRRGDPRAPPGRRAGPALRLHGRRRRLRHLPTGRRHAAAVFNSSWCVRVRRDDLLMLQVDGTEGSAVAGLRELPRAARRAHAQAGVEPRHRAAHRLLRRLAGGAGGRTLRQRLQGPVGAVPPARGQGRRPSAGTCSKGPRACSWPKWASAPGTSTAGWMSRRWSRVGQAHAVPPISPDHRRRTADWGTPARRSVPMPACPAVWSRGCRPALPLAVSPAALQPPPAGDSMESNA